MENSTVISNASISSVNAPENTVGQWDDATWILTASFIIFTMQSGFGLLEAGVVQSKNEVNIMVKNVVDVVFGGISYWIFGFGLSYGMDSGSNPFCGLGYWFVTSKDVNEMGLIYSNFIFQLSFTTTATTIVSGAMAERTKLTSYIIFSFFNTLVYCFPAHWVWGENGFLKTLGCIDVAGSGPVHLLGGVSALIGAALLGPRMGRYTSGNHDGQPCNPTNSVLGLFMLWWGWLAFNAGSTYGISGGKWKLASKGASITMIASIAGGIVGVLLSFWQHKKYLISDIINSVLGALVGITASCALVHPTEAVIIGAIGALIGMYMPRVVDYFEIDDPVGAFAVHGAGGLWGVIACGIFVDEDPTENMSNGQKGLLHGGGFYLLGVQILACVCIVVWTTLTTLLMLVPLKLTMGIRMDEVEETLGSDFVEHGINQDSRQAMLNTIIPKDKSAEGENFNGEVGAIATSTIVRQRSFFGGVREARSIRMKPAEKRKSLERSDTGISTTTLNELSSDNGV